MYKVIICDDNPIFLRLMEKILGNYATLFEMEIISFGTAGELMEYCRANPFDVVYMDIELDKQNNGMDFARLLKIINPKSLTIYISAYDAYYTEMVNAEPFRFVKKSECVEEKEGMEKFENDIILSASDAIKRIKGIDVWTFTWRRQQYSVSFTQIICIYSRARKIYIVSLKKLDQDFYYGKLEDIKAALEKASIGFVQINKKTIVNTSCVMRIKNKVKIGNKTFTIAPEYRQLFEKRFATYKIFRRDC